MSPRRRPLRKRLSVPGQTSAAWMTARARNALRRPLFVGAVSILTFAAALLALVVVPQQARRAAAGIRPAASARPDTEPTFNALMEATRQAAAAESSITAARRELQQLLQQAAVASSMPQVSAAGDTISGATRARRDSIAGAVETLSRLITRAENAPLLPSYRALAQAAPMQGDPRVRVLLDSLVEIERERESYTAVGGVDPVFVTLTARANELGRTIELLAEGRRATLQRELAALVPAATAQPAAAVAARPLPDTLEKLRTRDAARLAAGEVAARLAKERAELQVLDAREGRARELANVGASPPAMLAAALVFGAMLGFGAALFAEVRRPRIADAAEIERTTGVRVLGIIKPLPASPERGRRDDDRAGPRFIDPGADGHQLVYLTIATAGSSVVMLTVTGDSPAISAVVAMNFSAIASDEARSTLLMDTDGAANSIGSALRLRGGRGTSALVAERAGWSDAVRTVRLGRERAIDVIPASDGAVATDRLAALLQREMPDLSRRYDAIVLVSTPDQVAGGVAGAMPIPDVIVCARAGMTPVAALKRSVEEMQQAGAQIRGIVLWNAPEPGLAEARPMEDVERADAEAAAAVAV